MKSGGKKNSKEAATKKKRFCIQAECKEPAVSHGYCRLHYIANWKHIKFNNHVKAERRLNAYVDRLARKYPKDFLEKIKEGLENEEVFRATVEELEVDSDNENAETEREFLERLADKLKIGGGSE